ncbi:MAG: hypothetical protein JST84_10975 [Acidobacteria bacterium]|nr:hypothetical protein [Acidobacteriota bacterium]
MGATSTARRGTVRGAVATWSRRRWTKSLPLLVPYRWSHALENRYIVFLIPQPNVVLLGATIALFVAKPGKLGDDLR